MRAFFGGRLNVFDICFFQGAIRKCAGLATNLPERVHTWAWVETPVRLVNTQTPFKYLPKQGGNMLGMSIPDHHGFVLA